MAWVKMRHDLTYEVEVVSMAATLGIDEYAVVGRLHALWSWFDRHGKPGPRASVTAHVTLEWLDVYVKCNTFCNALVTQGWALHHDGVTTLPNAGRYIENSVKIRALTRDRVARYRARKAIDLALGNAQVTNVTPLDLDLDKTKTKKEEKKLPTQRVGKDSWLTPFADVWEQHVGTFVFGKAAKPLKQVVDAIGQEEAVRVFQLYCEGATDKTKLSCARFAETYRALSTDSPQQPRYLTPTQRTMQTLEVHARDRQVGQVGLLEEEKQ